MLAALSFSRSVFFQLKNAVPSENGT